MLGAAPGFWFACDKSVQLCSAPRGQRLGGVVSWDDTPEGVNEQQGKMEERGRTRTHTRQRSERVFIRLGRFPEVGDRRAPKLRNTTYQTLALAG